MNAVNVTVKSLDASKDWTVLSKNTENALDNAQHATVAQMHDTKIPVQTQSTNFHYAIDRESNALHLKVTSADGALVREIVFNRIDPRILDAQKLKGVFVNGKF